MIAGKYQVERVIGAGAMGVVVAAMHVDLGQRVAIKLLTSTSVDHSERFAREARALVRLRSAHAARVLDVGRVPDGPHYIVMEFLEGFDLDHVLDVEGPLDLRRAASYVVQACEAVAEAHSLGIVHRDLKPGNLFLANGVGGETVLKVLDYGIAKAIQPDGNGSLTQTSSLMGSPTYMSPEQMHSAKNVLPQNDVWALGVVLQELLTGRLPFEGDSFPALCLAVVHDEPRSPLLDRPDLPPAILDVISRCLEKNPADRYANAGELATALETLASPESSFVAERARLLTAAGVSRGTLASFADSPAARRFLDSPSVMASRPPSIGQPPSRAFDAFGATSGSRSSRPSLRRTASELAVDAVATTPPKAHGTAWLAAAAVASVLVVGAGVAFLRERSASGPPAMAAPDLAGVSAARAPASADLAVGLPVPVPPSVAVAPVAATRAAPDATGSAPPGAVGEDGKRKTWARPPVVAVKSGPTAATTPTPPPSPPLTEPKDDIPSLR